VSAPVTVTVSVPSGSYEVLIGQGVLERVGAVVAETCAARHVALVADETVADYFAEESLDSLGTAGIRGELLVIPPGEGSKTWVRAGDVLESMARAGLDRAGAVVALGGGVVGDLAGFCAAVYMRGVALVQVPTTLLSQVDSSIGGKTAVDLSAGKNLAGAFIQPRAVVSDTATLASLSETEWRSGLAEVAKSAVLDGEGFMAWLEAHAEAVVARDPDAVQEAVTRCVAFKAEVVGADERESGPRETLNLGHTLGHAIENVAGYGAVPHGLAVAEGMRLAAWLAERHAGAQPGLAERQGALLDSLGLTRTRRVYDIGRLRKAVSADKKSREGRPRFVLAVAPGEAKVDAVPEELLMEGLDWWVSSAGKGEKS
jgi:3-dehydroquinate synthase